MQKKSGISVNLLDQCDISLTYLSNKWLEALAKSQISYQPRQNNHKGEKRPISQSKEHSQSIG
jgi:hypothetical protein